MSTELTPLVENAAELLATQPRWGWYLARAWRAGRLGAIVPPPVLEPFIALASFETCSPDAAALSVALDEAANASRARDGRAYLLWDAGYLLPTSWTFALDELAAGGASPPLATPRFVDLARLDPERATRQVDRAFTEKGLRVLAGPDLLYAVLLACEDAHRPPPDTLVAWRTKFEATDGTLVDESARYTGRLRLAARQPGTDVLDLAKEAVHWVGADDVYAGLWAVLARVPGAVDYAPRWVEVLPRTPTPEVILSLLVKVGAAGAADVDARATALVAAVKAETVSGRRGWPAAWRLLGAAVSLGAERAVDSLLSLDPHWAVELATDAAVRRSPTLTDRIAAYQGEPEREGSPLEAPPPPPWAYLDPEVFRARLRFLADPSLGIPSGAAWGDGIP
jgi:hypothetical protein